MDIIIEPTDNAHWYTLVKQAHEQSGYQYNDNLESYLVITLQKFIQQNHLSQETITTRILQGVNESDHSGDLLRDVGDECLLISGLFPERAKKRNVTLEYYIHTGKTAYQHFALGNNHHCKNPDLFHELSEHFIGLMDILHLLRRK